MAELVANQTPMVVRRLPEIGGRRTVLPEHFISRLQQKRQSPGAGALLPPI